MSERRSRERRTVVYSGHVQGVGFRWTTVHLARGFDVVGYVRNLDDGCVEMVAEGSEEELNRFLAAVADEMQPHIRHSQISRSPGTDEFPDFTIRH